MVRKIKTDMKKWSKYSRWMGYVHNSEILDGIEGHKRDLDAALKLVGVSEPMITLETFSTTLVYFSSPKRLIKRSGINASL